MHRTPLIPTVAIAALWVVGTGPRARSADDVRSPAPSSSSAAKYADVRPQALAWIPPGTVIDGGPPKGWSHLVLQARPRLGVGDLDAIPKAAIRYSGLFLFTVLANVRDAHEGRGAPDYYLEKVALGGALDVGGKTVVATSDQTFGKDLGFIGRRVFQESESLVAADIRQVARTRTMLVFDGQAFVLYKGRHSRMVVRHVLVANPGDGTLTTLVWLLGSDGKGGYALAEPTLQILPDRLREDRVLSVDARRFTLGVPASDAFALARIPQGTPVRVSPTLAPLASARRFDPETALRLESELRARYVPLAAKAVTSELTTR